MKHLLLKENYDLKKHTTFKIGGEAQKVYFPDTQEALIDILNSNKNAIVLGNASNVLISSYGIDYSIIFTSNLKKVNIDNNEIQSECGSLGISLAKMALENSLSGFEFLIGFPSTVGGAVFMNASCHNQFISDTFIEGKFFKKESKEIISLKKDQMKFAYRTSLLMDREDLICLEARFRLKKGNKVDIENLMNRNLDFRKQYQPSLKIPNIGSIFKNPENDSAGRLLDIAGCKKFVENEAKVWKKHANFIVNNGNADSLDVLKLMKRMKDEVYNRYAINLIPEIRFIGGKNKEENEIWKNLIEIM